MYKWGWGGEGKRPACSAQRKRQTNRAVQCIRPQCLAKAQSGNVRQRSVKPCVCLASSGGQQRSGKQRAQCAQWNHAAVRSRRHQPLFTSATGNGRHWKEPAIAMVPVHDSHRGYQQYILKARHRRDIFFTTEPVIVCALFQKLVSTMRPVAVATQHVRRSIMGAKAAGARHGPPRQVGSGRLWWEFRPMNILAPCRAATPARAVQRAVGSRGRWGSQPVAV